MPQFTVRVELHQAQWTDYETLHNAMARQGFSRQITSNQGNTYDLPWAEYNRSGNLTSAQILTSAQKAAATTGKNNAVLVTEATSRAWSGLTISRN